MTSNKKIMIICAENSGDLLASELIDGLHTLDNAITFSDSLVGEECKKKGVNTITDLSLIAKMGFVEILSLIPTVFKLRKKILNVIDTQKPDMVIMVDGFAFTHFVAKKIKALYPNIKIVKYIAPKLWAWASWRAYKLKHIYDLILVCLPFETEFFANKNIKTYFVGHSVTHRMQMIKDTASKQDLKQKYNIGNDKKIILLLAGSRHSEISALLPVFLKTAENFNSNTHHFIIPIASGKEHYFKDLPNNYTLVYGTQERFKIFQIADVALAASGTVSLELMLAQVPTVIAYKVSCLTAKIAKWLVNVKYATLLNIMVDKPVFPEFIQENCTVDNLTRALNKSLYDVQTIEMQKKYCQIGTDLLYATDSAGNKIPAHLMAGALINKELYTKD